MPDQARALLGWGIIRIRNLAIDPQGHLYAVEVCFGRRAQKFELLSR